MSGQMFKVERVLQKRRYRKQASLFDQNPNKIHFSILVRFE